MRYINQRLTYLLTYLLKYSATAAAEAVYTPVSYTHLTLPTIYSV